MTDEQIIEAMAGIDTEGHKGFWCSECGDIDGANTRNDETCDLCGLPAQSGFPDYLTSHDACQRVIDTIPIADEIRKACRYSFHLGKVLGLKGGFGDPHYKNRATPRQKCEAILKAKGMWQKD